MSGNHLAKLNNDAEYIMNLALGYQIAQVLFAAVNLNLFTVVDSGTREVSEIANTTGSDKQSLSRLLNALVDLNLLEKTNGKYSNTESSSRYLVESKKHYLGNAIYHSSNLWDFWEGLDEQIKSGCGKGPDEEKIRNYHHRLKDYLTAMNDFAAIKTNDLADAIMIDEHRKMLDLGCGPGTYAIAFAERNPKLHCTMVDLEPNLVYTREFIHKSRCRDRVVISACNILEDELPGSGYDLILISNLIHIYGEREVKTIMKKAWGAVATPGKIVVHDYIMNESGNGPFFASLFDLTMLVGTPHGKCYTILEINELLESLGAKGIKQVPMSLGSSLVIGEK